MPEISLFGIREKQLLPVHLEVGNRLLAVFGDQPVMPLLCKVMLEMGMFLFRHQQAAILIEQHLITFEKQGQVLAVTKSHPCSAIRHYISIHCSCSIERWPHSTAQFAVPVAVRINAGVFPVPQLGTVGAAVITA